MEGEIGGYIRLGKDKESKDIGSIISFILCIIIGGIFGYAGVDVFDKSMAMSNNLVVKIIILIGVVLSFFVAVYVQIIVHEGGHYIFGKLTGYRLSSFRIGSTMFIRENGKIVRKKFNIAGTGGQCLMSPPDYKGDSYPYTLYNLGGSIINFLFGLLCFGLYNIMPNIPVLSTFLYVLFAIGLLFAVINGFPLKSGGIANDGYNLMSMINDSEARKAFWIQLKVNALQTSAIRLKDMPEEWFKWPEDNKIKNPLIGAIAVFCCNYYHDNHDFKKARELSEYLLKNDLGMLEVYRNELRCELLFYEIMDKCRLDIVEALYTKQLQKYIKITSSYISRKRLLYAYEVLVNKNEEEAQRKLEEFESVAKTYPYKCELESEREILEMIDMKSLDPMM